MESQLSLEILLILLLSSHLFSSSLSQPLGNCAMLSVFDLGTITDISNVGLIPQTVGMPLKIKANTLLCLSSGNVRSTYRSASALVEYHCPDCTNEMNVNQFTFICDINQQWILNPDSPINREPLANFSVETETRCSLCSPNPSLSYNLVTYCIGELTVVNVQC